jgi:hypothetical protein
MTPDVMFCALQAGNQKFCVSKLDMTPDVIKMWSAIVGYTATGLKMEKDFPKDRPLASSTASIESEHTCKLFIEPLQTDRNAVSLCPTILELF